MNRIDNLIFAMADYEAGNAHQIQHSLKVHAFAKLIAGREGLDERTLEILEAAAVVHDVGIKPAMEKYGSSEGKLQELEGPAPACALLEATGLDAELIDRVCYLVAHHHTIEPVDGMDYRILLEADLLVNLFEEHAGADAVEAGLKRVFRTPTGIALCKTMFCAA